MPLAEITAAVQSAKAAIDFVKGAKALIDKVEVANLLTDVYNKLISAQSQTLSLQTDHNALIQENDKLRQQVMKFENWKKTESEYELYEPDPGSFVYAYKKTEDTTKPKHWLCPNCWEDRTKSILQCEYQHSEGAKYNCPRCKAVVSWYHSRPQRYEPPEDRWRW
jgi:predicted RNA-binding Zn-ribbon protein involved in translation (DUF1610 family)